MFTSLAVSNGLDEYAGSDVSNGLPLTMSGPGDALGVTGPAGLGGGGLLGRALLGGPGGGMVGFLIDSLRLIVCSGLAACSSFGCSGLFGGDCWGCL